MIPVRSLLSHHWWTNYCCYVRACVRARERARARACVCVCVCVYVCDGGCAVLAWIIRHPLFMIYMLSRKTHVMSSWSTIIANIVSTIYTLLCMHLICLLTFSKYFHSFDCQVVHYLSLLCFLPSLNRNRFCAHTQLAVLFFYILRLARDTILRTKCFRVRVRILCLPVCLSVCLSFLFSLSSNIINTDQ